MVQLADDLAVWTKRNRYGRFRPPGWCTIAQRLQRAREHSVAASVASTTAAATGSVTVGGSAVHGMGPNGMPALHRSSSDPGRLHKGASGLGASQQGAHEENAGRRGHRHASTLFTGSPEECYGQLVDPSSSSLDNQSGGTAAPADEEAGGTARRSSSSGGNSDSDGQRRVYDSTLATTTAAAAASDATATATRSAPGKWTLVWRYAVRAVLHDIRERRGTHSLRDYLRYKRQYTRLHRRKLEHLRQSESASGARGASICPVTAAATAAAGAISSAPPLSDAEQVELQRLEADLAVSDILTFRQLTERALEEEHERERERGRAAQGDSSAPTEHRSWLAWGLSGVSGFFLYGGGAKAAAPQVPPALLTEAELAELYQLLQGTSLQAVVAAGAPQEMSLAGGHHPHHHHHHHQHHQQQQLLQHRGSVSGAAGSASAAPATTGMPLLVQLRFLHVTLDVKGPSGSGMPNSKVGGSWGGAATAGAAPAPPAPAAAPTLLSLGLGSVAVAVESDGTHAAVQSSIGTIHMYDMCTDPGVAECILMQAELDPDYSGAHAAGVGSAANGGAAAAAASGVAGGSSSPGADASIRHRRRTTHGSWASLSQLLAVTSRSSGLHASMSTDSLDADVGHWAMGASQTHAVQSMAAGEAWHCGSPVVVLSKAAAGCDADGESGLLDVHVRPLRLLYRPQCFAAVAAAMAVDSTASLEHHTMHAVAAFACRDARLLARLQHLGCTAPSQRLRIQVEGLEVVMPAEGGQEQPTGTAAAAASSSRMGSAGSASNTRPAVTPGHLTIALYDVQLSSLAEPSPSTTPASLSPPLSPPLAVRHSEVPPPAAAAAASAAAAADVLAAPSISIGILRRLEHLLQRRLHPSSTAADLAAVAAEASTASAAAAAAAAVAEGAPGSPATAITTITTTTTMSSSSTLSLGMPCSVDGIERLVLYDHMRFAVGAVHVSYQLPAVQSTASQHTAAAAATAAATAPGYTSYGAPGSQGRQPTTYQRAAAAPVSERGWHSQSGCSQDQPKGGCKLLLPPSLRLHGVLSRSRLPQDADVPATAIRLGLSGLSCRLHSSQVADIQQLISALSPSSAPAAQAPLSNGSPVGAAATASPATTPSMPPPMPFRISMDSPSNGISPAGAHAGPGTHQRSAAASAPPTPSNATAAAAAAGAAAPPASASTGLRRGFSLSLSRAARRASCGGGGAATGGEGSGAAGVSAAPVERTRSGTLMAAAGLSNEAAAGNADDDGVQSAAPVLSAPPPPPPRSRFFLLSQTSAPAGGSSAFARVQERDEDAGERDNAQPQQQEQQQDEQRNVAGAPPAAAEASSLLRLPLLPQTTGVQLFVEPFEITYVLDHTEDGGALATDGCGGAAEACMGETAATNSERSGRGGGGCRTICIRTAHRADLTLSTCSDGSATQRMQLSVSLRGLSVQTGDACDGSTGGGSGGGASFLLALPHIVSATSITASLAKTHTGSVSVCGAVSGLRLLGPVSHPGHFVLSNGADRDEAGVAVRYWSAGAEPPPDPATAAAEAAAYVAAGWWQRAAHPQSRQGYQRRGGDGGADVTAAAAGDRVAAAGEAAAAAFKAAGGSSGSGSGGLELRVSDVALGMGLLVSLAGGGGSGGADERAEKQPRPRSQSQSQSQRPRESDPAAPDGARQTGLPSPASASSSGSGGGAEAAHSEPAAAATAADTPATPPPLQLSVALHNCAILAVAPSRTPFATASGAGHLACHALLSLEHLSLNSEQQGAHDDGKRQQQPQHMQRTSPRGVNRSSIHANGADGAAAPTAAEGDAAAEEEEVAEVLRSVVPAAPGYAGVLRGLLLYMADNPDSAYLSPVLLLPELRARYSPAAAAGAGRGTARTSVVGSEKDAGVGLGLGGAEEASVDDVDGAAGTAEPQQQRQRQQAMSLSVELARLEACLQPQQAGVICALLSDLSPDQSREATPPLQQPLQQQPRGGYASPLPSPVHMSGVAGPSNGAAMHGVPVDGREDDDEGVRSTSDDEEAGIFGLPRLSVSVDLGLLTALLGSDTLSEEATALYWRDVSLSYDYARRDVTCGLSWQELTLASVGARLDPGQLAGQVKNGRQPPAEGLATAT
ncbi:hypothetical protein Agub_g6998, partial [Astrephomene gubernaculifera]